MKKREKKMQLNRETLTRLVAPAQLANARGGVEALAQDETGRWTSCIEPNCCGGVDTQ